MKVIWLTASRHRFSSGMIDGSTEYCGAKASTISASIMPEIRMAP